jgi:hypothetical protein
MIFVVGANLVITGPLRAMWRRRGQPRGLIAFLPVLIPMLLLQWGAVFPMLFAHPIQAMPSTHLRGSILFLVSPGSGTMGMIWYSTALMSISLLALRRWRLPFGSLTLIIGGHFLMLAPQNMLYSGVLVLVGAAFVGGLAGDLLLAVLQPAYDQPLRLYAFAFLLPAVLISALLAAIYALGQMAWTLHLVLGNIVISGVIGLAAAGVFTTIARPIVP